MATDGVGTDDRPRAFLSHSSVDKAAFARRLAGDLSAHGVTVWFDEWEIAPGESLRRKIDEGIEQATHFLAAITPNSIRSEWVQTELDAGMVKRIEGSCRLIPVLVGVACNDLPPTLRAIKCISFDDYDAGLRELVDACHGVSRRPEVQPPPRWAKDEPLPTLGLSKHAQRLAALLNERSENGVGDIIGHDPCIDDRELMKLLDLSARQLGMAAHELKTRGWVDLLKRNELGVRGETGFTHLAPKAALFIETDPGFKGWDPKQDAKLVAAALINLTSDPASMGDATMVDLKEALSWEPRRLNPAACHLVATGGADSIGDALGQEPFSYCYLSATPGTHSFAEGDDD